MGGVCIVNCLNYSTYNSYRTHDGIVNTFRTNNYSMREMSQMVMIPGHVQHSLPILSEYYWSQGMYSSSSSSSDGSSSENEPENQCEVAFNSNPSLGPVSSTLPIDVQQYFVKSTNDFEGVEYISTDLECWSSSPSSLSVSSFSTLCSSTSEYSAPPKPTYRELLDYSPSNVNQPQPTDSIFVPLETLGNSQLRNPPVVELRQSVRLDLQSLNNFFRETYPQPSIAEEDEDVTIYNAMPEIVKVSSETGDSDVMIV